MDGNQLRELSEKSQKLLLEAGEFILKSWNTIGTVNFKDARDVVTDVDVKVEEMLKKGLQELLPEAGFLVEEGQTVESDGYQWVIDPIDATKNYVGKLPMFVSQIALTNKGELLLGQVYNPVSKQFFSASKGNGVTVNGKKVELQPRESLKEAIVEVDFGGKDELFEKKMKVLEQLYGSCYRVKVSGACLFSAYLLTGAIDAFVILDPKIKKVDYLPYFMLFQEAGFVIHPFYVEKTTIYVIAKGQLLEQLKEQIKAALEL